MGSLFFRGLFEEGDAAEGERFREGDGYLKAWVCQAHEKEREATDDKNKKEGMNIGGDSDMFNLVFLS